MSDFHRALRHISVFIALFWPLAQPATAMGRGNEDAGGGDAVWVQFGDTSFAFVLDYYMGYRLHYIEPAEILQTMGAATGEDPHAKVRRVLKRLRRVDQDLAQRATATLDLFKLIAHFPREDIISVPDEDLEIPLENDAVLLQAARWVMNDEGGVIGWTINKRVWDKLDDNDRAGLILHEIFYVLHASERFATGDGFNRDPRELRRFVALISSTWMTTVSVEAWRSFVKDTGLFCEPSDQCYVAF